MSKETSVATAGAPSLSVEQWRQGLVDHEAARVIAAQWFLPKPDDAEVYPGSSLRLILAASYLDLVEAAPGLSNDLSTREASGEGNESATGAA